MSNLSSTLTRPESTINDSQSVNDASAISAERARLLKRMKSLYQADQQAKFLNLQEEVDSLLQQLQSLKQQKDTFDEEIPAQAATLAVV